MMKKMNYTQKKIVLISSMTQNYYRKKIIIYIYISSRVKKTSIFTAQTVQFNGN